MNASFVREKSRMVPSSLLIKHFAAVHASNATTVVNRSKISSIFEEQQEESYVGTVILAAGAMSHWKLEELEALHEVGIAAVAAKKLDRND